VHPTPCTARVQPAIALCAGQRGRGQAGGERRGGGVLHLQALLQGVEGEVEGGVSRTREVQLEHYIRAKPKPSS